MIRQLPIQAWTAIANTQREKHMMRKTWTCITSTLLFLLAGGVAHGAFPDRPITLIVNYSAGGGTDLVARAIAKQAEKFLGQPIAVMNRPGAGGTIGVSAVATAKPDGYTVGIVTSSTLAIAPHVLDVPYEPFNDFQLIAGIGEYVYGTSVPVDSPFKNLKDLVEYAKANPDKINYGVTGLSVNNNLAMVKLMQAANVKMTPVVFKNTIDEVTAVLGGHIDVTNQDPPAVVGHINAGKLRLLASFSDKRWSWVPDVPTARELGYDFSVGASLGVAAPKGVPEAIMERLRSAFKSAAETPEFKKAVDSIYLVPKYRDHSDWETELKAALIDNEKMVRDLGLHKSQQKK